MARFVLRRVFGVIPLLLLVSIAVFLLITLVPGDPARAIGGPDASHADIQRITKQYHLDRPLAVQYGYWLKDAVRLDLGESRYSHERVIDGIKERFPVTMSVVVAAAIVALLIGIPFGLVAGIRPGHGVDNVARITAGIGLSLPNFVLAIILVILLGVERQWLPILGFTRFTDNPWEWARHVLLPAVTLGGVLGSVMIRQLRAAMIDVLDSNYVRAAWARGGTPKRVVMQHALKNAAMPAVTVFGLQIAGLLGGAVIVEQIFSIPGIGPYILTGIVGRDVPVVQAVTLLFVVCQTVVSMGIDISYGLLNPKIRVS
jgi:peptide/nickel transport system permease protein